MMKKTKLELTWIGKDERPRLEPRVLVEDLAKSYHAAERVSDNDFFDNRLIFGDNLLALKALEQEFAGKIKCIYIDPPYNTGSAFEHYDDGIEHSLWLSMMRERLELLRGLLRTNGSIWISIDDNEAHYLRVLCDEVFGRSNFIANIVWQKAYTSNQTAKHLSDTHDHLLLYARDSSLLQLGRLERSEEQRDKFKNHDDDPRGPWKAENLSAGKFYAAGQFVITGPTGKEFVPPKGRYWRCNEEQYEAWLADGRITFGKAGTGRPMLKKYLSEMTGGLTANTWWTHQEAGSNKEASIHLKAVLGSEVDAVFQNPKPEKLIQRVLALSTDAGDLILDSFAGSGTTGAVAHKMGRKWIMVELGDHCHTHIIPRLKKVIDDKDSGGITQATAWKGGGGFRYYSLAPSLLQKDDFGHWVINREYDAAKLAQAVCKIEGFTYAPSDAHYWQHGHSTERDYIYVTTQTLTREQIEGLSEEVGPNRSLVIYCRAFKVRNTDQFPNLTLKKIPKAVLTKCEWGHDDYSLEIKNLPAASPSANDDIGGPPPPNSRRSRKAAAGQPTLFSMEGGEQ